jgi:hypothetical protein
MCTDNMVLNVSPRSQAMMAPDSICKNKTPDRRKNFLSMEYRKQQ